MQKLLAFVFGGLAGVYTAQNFDIPDLEKSIKDGYGKLLNSVSDLKKTDSCSKKTDCSSKDEKNDQD